MPGSFPWWTTPRRSSGDFYEQEIKDETDS